MTLTEFYELPIGEREKLLEKVNGKTFAWHPFPEEKPQDRECVLCFGPELVVTYDAEGETITGAGQCVLQWNPTGDGDWWCPDASEWYGSTERVTKWQRLTRNP